MGEVQEGPQHEAFCHLPAQLTRRLWLTLRSSGLSLWQLGGGFGSQPEVEVGPQWQEHWTLTTRPVGGDKLVLQLCRRELQKTESSETNEVFVKKRVQYVWIDTSRLRGRVPESRLCSSLSYLYAAFSSGFPLTSHFDFPGSESKFGLPQDPSLCVHASLSQDGFFQGGLWVAWHHVTSLPFDLQGAFLCLHSQGSLLTLRMRNMWSLIFDVDGAQLSPTIVLLSRLEYPGCAVYLLSQLHWALVSSVFVGVSLCKHD